MAVQNWMSTSHFLLDMARKFDNDKALCLEPQSPSASSSSVSTLTPEKSAWAMSALRALLDLENPAFVSNTAVDEVSSRFGRRKAASSDDILCDKKAARYFVRPSASNQEIDEMSDRQKQGIRLWNNIITYLQKTLDKQEQPLARHSHRKCFLGTLLVSSIREYLRAITGYEPTKDEVYCLCDKLVLSSIVERVKTGRSVGFKDSATYRFTSQYDHQPKSSWSAAGYKGCVRSKSTLLQFTSTLKSWKDKLTSNPPLPSDVRDDHMYSCHLDRQARRKTHQHCLTKKYISSTCHNKVLDHCRCVCSCCQHIPRQRVSSAHSPQTVTNLQPILPHRDTSLTPVHSTISKNDQESSWTLYGFL